MAEVVQAPLRPVLPGEFPDLLAAAADGLVVRGPRLRVAALDRIESFDPRRREPELPDSLAAVGEAEPAEPAVQRVGVPGPPVVFRNSGPSG